jgi:Zn-dependent protease
MDELNLAQKIAVWSLPVIFAITWHEVAHGWVALRCGDPTARDAGRLSSNPLRHIDPIGTIVLPVLLLMASNFVFGWAKPVPVDWRRLRNPRRDFALVSLAGPFSNLLMALFWVLILKLGVSLEDSSLSSAAEFMVYVGIAGLYINCVLCVLNLLPLPPLDGAHTLYGLLPQRWLHLLFRYEIIGLLLLMALAFSGLLSQFLFPVVLWLVEAFAALVGL